MIPTLSFKKTKPDTELNKRKNMPRFLDIPNPN